MVKVMVNVIVSNVDKRKVQTCRLSKKSPVNLQFIFVM